MPLEQIISIIVFVVVLVFIWGVFKKLFKLLFYVGIIISLLMAANLYFIYQDFQDLRENFASSEKKVILKDGDKILTGLLLNEDTNLMTNAQLNEYSSYLIDSDYEKILDDSYKLMIFDVEIISNLDDEIEIENQTTEYNRARQNVIFEFGFFIGKLGRQRVCAIHLPDVELPSDMAGVLYIPFDKAGAWKFKLAREIQAAGLDVDLNKIR